MLVFAPNANSYRRLDVSTLANFPSGQAYSIFYESNVPVTVTAPPVSSQPVVSAPPVASTPPLYNPPVQPYVEHQPIAQPQAV